MFELTSPLYLATYARGQAHQSQKGINEGIRLVASLCGNGIKEGNEACDDGNHDNFDTCNFLCQEASF